jgi:transposase-like protein
MSQPSWKPAEYAMELKLAAVRRVRAGESVRAVAQDLGIRRGWPSLGFWVSSS